MLHSAALLHSNFSHLITSSQTALVKPATNNSRDVPGMTKTCEMRETCEKKVRTWDNVKINYTRFAIWLFSSTIILSLIVRENSFVSCIITASTARQFETWEICLVKQHKKYEITCAHVSCLACFSHLTDRIVCRQLYSMQFAMVLRYMFEPVLMETKLQTWVISSPFSLYLSQVFLNILFFFLISLVLKL